MNTSKILIIINHILQKKNKSPLTQLNPQSLLQNDLGLDSLDLAELTVRVEDEFGVDIFQDGIISTIGEILNQVED